MKTTEVQNQGALNERHLTELADQLDPAIGEASSVMGAMATELIRRSLRGGVLQIGRELGGYVSQQVEQQIVEQRPLIEKTAAETATEVARGEVDAVRQNAHEQVQQLAARLEDASRQARQSVESVARDLTGRLDETSRQAHAKIDTVAKVIDDKARQTLETTTSLAQSLQTEVTAVETRTLDTARKELSHEIEAFTERAKQATGKIKERLDKLDAKSAQLADLQRGLKQELLDAWRTDKKQLLQHIDGLRRANESLAERLAELEKPRGLRRWFGWLFGGNKKSAPVEPDTDALEEGKRT